MSETLQAIERVADKRHAKAITLGIPEKQAASMVNNYLEHLKLTWKENKNVLARISALQKGYSAKI